MYPLTRRSFLAASAAASAAALRPRLVGASVPPIVLTPQAGQADLLGEGEPSTPVWAFNGDIPGPVLRLKRGEDSAIDVVNRLEQPTSVHWHGLRIANAMDGAAGLTQDPIAPGARFAYRFTPPDAGTFWYHSHQRSWEQMARGLAGLLIVEDPEEPAVDRDIPMALDDWRLSESGAIHEESFGALHDWAHGGRLGNWLTVNGASTPKIALGRNERVRLRLANIANARVLRVALAGLEARVIAIDGMAVTPFDLPADGVILAPGQRADLVADVRLPAGARASLNEISSGEAVEAARFLVGPGAPGRQAPLETPYRLPAPALVDPDLDKARRYELLMEGGAMGGLQRARHKGRMLDMRALVDAGMVWAFNGAAAPMAEPSLRLNRGESAILRIVNDTAWPHAMHLHGHHFKILGAPRLERAGLWRDTALVDADETMEIALIADNPGKWLIHCHMLEHQVSGMIAWFEVA